MDEEKNAIIIYVVLFINNGPTNEQICDKLT